MGRRAGFRAVQMAAVTSDLEAQACGEQDGGREGARLPEVVTVTHPAPAPPARHSHGTGNAGAGTHDTEDRMHSFTTAISAGRRRDELTNGQQT